MGARIASTAAAEPFDDSWAEKIVCRERLCGTVRYRLRVLMIRGPDGEDLPPIRITDEHPFWVVEL